MKLKQNLSKEVVWVMKDDSFINLIYFLAVENSFNNSAIGFSPQNMNLINKINEPIIMNTLKRSVDSNMINNETIAEINRINTIKGDDNNIHNNNINIINNKINNNYNLNKVNNTHNINNNNLNNNNKDLNFAQQRTTKKIIQRKADINMMNGGVINAQNINNNINTIMNNNNNDLNNNNIENNNITRKFNKHNTLNEMNKYNTYNTYNNNNINFKRQSAYTKLKKEPKNIDNKQAQPLKKMESSKSSNAYVNKTNNKNVINSSKNIYNNLNNNMNNNLNNNINNVNNNMNNNLNYMNNNINYMNKKNINGTNSNNNPINNKIFDNKTKIEINHKKKMNTSNFNNELYYTASPKNKDMQDTSFINKNEIFNTSIMSTGGIGSSKLNNSDIFSISMRKNEKLNATINTVDTCIAESEYKILSNNNAISDENNIYSKNYISKLDFKEYEYDTFCQAVIKTGLNESKVSFSKFSQNFPATCGHELCSKLPAFEPHVLNFYQNTKKSSLLDGKLNATSHLIFPLGIKLCINQNFHNQELSNEPLINTIYNEKGDIYYIASLTYYRKISFKNYNKLFKINPVNVYNKFKMDQKAKNKMINNNTNANNIVPNANNPNNNNNNMNNTNNNNNLNMINNSIPKANEPSINNKNANSNNIALVNQKNLERNNTNKESLNINKNINKPNNLIHNKNNNDILIFRPNDIIYIPECLSLVSRFPFFNQLSYCLKIIINMRKQMINGDNNQEITKNISLFINHIINQIPVGSNKVNILFYTPMSIEPITLYNPFAYNFGNFNCPNIFSILSIENIITIFLLVLLEQKIIFVDTNHLILSSISYFFINLIYPLTWVNTYEPLLSLSTIRYIQSITPFIMGGNESLILFAYHKKYIIYNENCDNIDKSNIVFVNLSSNLISCDCFNLIVNKRGQNRKTILKYLGIPDLPKSIDKKLYNHLTDIEKITNLKQMNIKLKTFFCRIMVFILDDYKDYFLYSLEKPIFNKDNYLLNKKEDKLLFYKELLGTQLFTQFIFNENELYKMKKTGGRKLKQREKTYGLVHDGAYKDISFFMKNKNKIEELKIMIKKRRKDKLRKPLLSAKKLVKNIGQMFSAESKKKEKSQRKSVKTNLSVIKHKKEAIKISNVLLMPYFIEEPDVELNDAEKYDYIQNKLNSIITLDNQLNQINNYKNKYIFDFNQKFDLKIIKDDNTRYFIGTLNRDENNFNNDISKLDFSTTDVFNFNPKLNSKGNNNSNKNTSTTPNVSRKQIKRRSNMGTGLFLNQKLVEEEEKKFIESKEKINIWLTTICMASHKKKINPSTLVDILPDLKIERCRKFFSKLISQNSKTLFDIRENKQNFVNNESFIELAQKVKLVLSFMTYNEYETCKLVTLSCFKYYTILEEHKHTRYYLSNKLTQIFTPCDLWLDNIFWKTWFDEDISYIEKIMNLSDDNEYDLNKSNEEDNELYEYNEENNSHSIEYRLLIKINNVMTMLKLEKDFVKKVIYEDLAPNYLSEYEINLFKDLYD